MMSDNVKANSREEWNVWRILMMKYLFGDFLRDPTDELLPRFQDVSA